MTTPLSFEERLEVNIEALEKRVQRQEERIEVLEQVFYADRIRALRTFLEQKERRRGDVSANP